MRRLWLTFFCFLATGGTLCAGHRLVGDTAKNPLEYSCGEEIVFTVKLQNDDGGCSLGHQLRWKRTGDDGVIEEGQAVSGNEPLVIKTSSAVPGTVLLEVKAPGTRAFEGGALVGRDQLCPPPEPAGFRQNCSRLSEDAGRVELQAKLDRYDAGTVQAEAYQFTIPLTGGMVTTGTMLIPVGAEPKSLSARVHFQGYGAYAARLTANDFTPGEIVTAVSAHGIDNLQEEVFYKKLEAGKLKRYGFKDNDPAEKSYFYGMLFRDLVALRFIKSLSAWNRKSLLVEGGSQGGFQALAMAALDPEVTGCRAIVPWMGDIGGEKLGRKKIGWRPESSPGLACYDIIHFGKMIKCPVELQITLGDPVCPVAGRWLLWMALRAPTKLTAVQNVGHTGNYWEGKTKFILEK